MGKDDTLLNALIGALVTVVLSFTGFSPVIGGGVAGYLQQNGTSDGLRVGAISGLVASVPMLLVFLLFLGAVPFLPFELAALSFVFLLFVGIFLVGYTVLLSAVGGYVGGYVEKEY